MARRELSRVNRCDRSSRGWKLRKRSGQILNPLPMSTLPVLAEVSSKLHADIAIIRLLRAGVRADQVSAIFPQGRAPNSVCCWLTNFHRIPIASGMPIAAAGLLGRLFRNGVDVSDREEQLDQLGLTAEMTRRLVEKMEDGRLIVCVHARNEADAAVAWHIFEHVGADHIAAPADHGERSTPELPAMPALWADIAA